jgi:hypothetical protein
MNGNVPSQRIRPIITVGLDDNDQVVITGPLDKKEMCLNLLVDAAKFVLNIEAAAKPNEEQSNIIMPQR